MNNVHISQRKQADVDQFIDMKMWTFINSKHHLQ